MREWNDTQAPSKSFRIFKEEMTMPRSTPAGPVLALFICLATLVPGHTGPADRVTTTVDVRKSYANDAVVRVSSEGLSLVLTPDRPSARVNWTVERGRTYTF